MKNLSPDEPLILINERMTEPAVLSVADGTVAIFSTTSPDKETMNEDAAAIIPLTDGSAVLVVADGLGGTRLGGEAARCAVHALERAVRGAEGSELQGAILQSIEGAHREIIALGTGAATTIAVAEIREKTIRTYHAGDSMILLLGQRGKIKLQTISHSPVGFALEAGMLDEKEAMHHEDRNIVCNMVGAPDTRVVVGMPLDTAPRDTLLLASDGLTDNLHIDEVVSRLRKGPVAEGADRLVRDSRSRMERPRVGKPSHPDDLTFLVFRRDPPPKTGTRR